ncbi:magnesium transporter [Flocculibacter collagenilyticus]|uniref:magnesium transporter n=1 Tax=Flocculibacter collagenilyticus TaxID=2744479 RepID=UPI0018F44066|nr:magnesium transporter [Flocculibacter collagenilyticus]
MPSQQQILSEASQQLNREFLQHFPYKSARHMEAIEAHEAAKLLEMQSMTSVLALWKFLPAGTAENIFAKLSSHFAIKLLQSLDSHIAVTLLSRLEPELQQQLMKELATSDGALASELTELLSYPEDTAARLMSAKVTAFYDEMSASDVLRKLKQRKDITEDVIYILNKSQQLVGQISLAKLIIANAEDKLLTLAQPIKATFSALDSKDEVIEKFEGYRSSCMPVLDSHQQLIGVIRFSDIYQSTKEDLVSDMQTMVGASKEEKALSSSWFAVTKRLPWLQINLLTAFAAASVVGAFEGLISEITALAILLPVAAGQSGNAGAQALAVTMRGLTLREITTRQWMRVMSKEFLVGAMNGVAVATTCSIAIYFWSQSFGLALVMAIAMVCSLSIACTAGAIVPIALKKFGMDPAQSSSIVLTTITDIAGFMSFLGIAMLLSDMLPRG